MKQLKVKKLSYSAKLPTRSHPQDAGLDLYSSEYDFLSPGESGLVATDIAVEIPPGYVGLITGRSSMSKKKIMAVLGTIDSGYQGPLGVILTNNSPDRYQINVNDRIAQLLIVPIVVPEVEEVKQFETATERGEGGFGSTGV